MNNDLKERVEEKTSSISVLKKDRVNCQKNIYDLEKKLDFYDVQLGQNQIEPTSMGNPVVNGSDALETNVKELPYEGIKGLDVKQDIHESKRKAEDILKSLKNKLDITRTGEQDEDHFIRGCAMGTVQKE